MRHATRRLWRPAESRPDEGHCDRRDRQREHAEQRFDQRHEACDPGKARRIAGFHCQRTEAHHAVEARESDEAADEQRIAVDQHEDAIVARSERPRDDHQIDQAHSACRSLAAQQMA